MTLSVGTATAIITPPVGTWLEGYGGKDHGEGDGRNHSGSDRSAAG